MANLRSIGLDDLCVRPLFGTLGPSAPVFDDTGESLYYLRPDDASRLSLCRYEISSGTTAVIVDSEERAYNREEELRRERKRQQSDGVSGFFLRGGALLVDEGGPSRVVSSTDGSPLGNYDLGGLHNCRFLTDDSVVGTTGTSVEVATSDGGRTVLLAAPDTGVQVGVAEYVAQEELDRLTGLWPDPSGSYVALTVIDDRHVPEFPLLHWGSPRPALETIRYPFVGEENAHCSLVFAERASGKIVPCELTFGQGYLGQVAWRDEETLIVTRLSRAQDVLEWFAVRADSGKARLLWREEGEPWVNLPEGIFFSEDGTLVSISEANDGRGQLFCMDLDGHKTWMKTESLIVEALLDVRNDTALVTASEHDVRERHLYLVPLDGRAPVRVSKGVSGFHTGALSGDGETVIDVWSSRSCPMVAEVVGRDSRRVLGSPRNVELPFELVLPQFVDVRGANGDVLHGCLYRPKDWAGGPAVVIVYGGPHVQLVRDTWTLRMDPLAQYLASAGVLVFKLDNRGSWGRGRAFEGTISRKFGTIELEDQLCGVEYLVSREGVDRGRIGITGWSYGGFMTLTALVKAPGKFAVGVAGAPVVDFSWYDTAYTERYMGTIEDAKQAYEEASLLSCVGNLADPLMIVHGAVDENVHFRHSARLLQAFSEADKSVELVLLPESRHSPRGAHTLRTESRARTSYLLSHLGVTPTAT